MNELEAAQNNLNNNMDNEVLQKKFIEKAKEVRKNLQERYGENWNDPAKLVKADEE